nr:uncharacterized mitochondrial protein AtMg00810-like [Tanacetum cinerariifolium]
MDVKSAFLYRTIKEEVYVCQPPGFEDPDYPDKEEVYVCQPPGFEDPDYPDKVYKVFKELYGLHQAPRAWYETLVNYLLENGFQRASTPIDTKKPLLKDPDGEDVDVHTYRLMIGSLMYLTSSRPDIMFAVFACAHFQVTPKASHQHAVKRIFRYLKVQLNAVQRHTLLDFIFLSFGLTMQVILSGMESLKRKLHVTNILSAGYLTRQQMVLNSPCLTHIKNWLVQIKRSLVKTHQIC